MSWWERIFGRSRTNQLIDLVRASHEANATVMGKVADSIAQQSGVMQQYFAMISAPPAATQVRVMSDLDQVNYERLREVARGQKQAAIDALVPPPSADPYPVPGLGAFTQAFEMLQ